MTLDPSSFVAPLFTAVITAMGVWVAMSRQVAVLQADLRNLTKQVEKHNSVVERTYKLETDEATMWRRIDELREEVRHNSDRLDTLRIGGTE